MKLQSWLLIVSMAYILQGFKSFNTDDWAIIYMWIGLGGACVYFYTNRKKYTDEGKK